MGWERSASQGRYIDAVIAELDHWIRPELTSAESLFYYRTIRRVLVAFAAEAPAQPMVTEAPIAPYEGDVGALSDRALEEAALEEGSRLDAALAQADARLAKGHIAAPSMSVSHEALEACLRTLGHADARVVEMRVLTGGRSKQTILFSAEGLAGMPRDLVMRRDIQTGTLRTTVIDEFALLQVLHRNGVKVPEPYVCGDDPALIGTPFLIMRAAKGAVAGEPMTPPSSVDRTLEAARALACVHRVPVAELSALAMFARAAPTAKSPAEEARALHGVWRTQARGASPTVEATFRWLHANAPKASDQRALVHGDYQFYNLMYDGEALEAVLDWELAHIGHPAEDLGFIRGCVTPVVPWTTFMDTYGAAGGADVSDCDVAVFALLSNLRLMSYVLRGRAFFETGETDSIQKAEVAVYFLPRLMQQVSRVMREIIGSR